MVPGAPEADIPLGGIVVDSPVACEPDCASKILRSSTKSEPIRETVLSSRVNLVVLSGGGAYDARRPSISELILETLSSSASNFTLYPMMVGSTLEARRNAEFAVSVTSLRAAVSAVTWVAFASTMPCKASTWDIFFFNIVAFSNINFRISESSCATVLSSSAIASFVSSLSSRSVSIDCSNARMRDIPWVASTSNARNASPAKFAYDMRISSITPKSR